ncbi:MAG: hypothetical protein Q4F17_00050 [Eubacteriales bacterium]|nr:hypothetical protein [Eubacteriales bacterium]
MEHLPSRYRDVRVDAFAVMPNHIHVILAIGCSGPMQTAKNPTLSSVIALYKAGVSRRIHQLDPSVKVWQTSFYDEIIKNQRHYLAAWNYVAGNPQK